MLHSAIPVGLVTITVLHAPVEHQIRAQVAILMDLFRSILMFIVLVIVHALSTLILMVQHVTGVHWSVASALGQETLIVLIAFMMKSFCLRANALISVLMVTTTPLEFAQPVTLLVRPVMVHSALTV